MGKKLNPKKPKHAKRTLPGAVEFAEGALKMYADGMSFAEIAKHYGCGFSTVGKKLRLAKQRISTGDPIARPQCLSDAEARRITAARIARHAEYAKIKKANKLQSLEKIEKMVPPLEVGKKYKVMRVQVYGVDAQYPPDPKHYRYCGVAGKFRFFRGRGGYLETFTAAQLLDYTVTPV